MSRDTSWSDRRLLLTLGGAMLVLIVAVSLLVPQSAEDDPRPTTTNTGPQGAKAAYLLLQALGRSTSRWNRPLAEWNEQLGEGQAARTTLILAAPQYDSTDQAELAAEVRRFLEQGGRVLATGPSGAVLLPGGAVEPAGMMQRRLCQTTPEGPGPLARVGSVAMREPAQWSAEGPQYRVEQRCGAEAAVVRFRQGQGEAIWWSSAGPLENAQLKNDADLRLLLASVGDGRDVVFDESLHGVTKTLWEMASGLPLGWLALQTALVLGLLVLSFSRRRGPLRSPVERPRSSPVEFAESMGDLYEKGGATSAATAAARRRLLRVLLRDAGLPQATIDEGPDAIAEGLGARLGGEWLSLREHLREAAAAELDPLDAKSALALVRALSDDAETVRARLAPGETVDGEHTEDSAEEPLELAGT